MISIFNFIEEVRNYIQNNKIKKNFIFHHISTDEVYGDLEKNNNAFTELAPYRPSSPYSASKASIDHILRAYFRTYNFPVVISVCSNNLNSSKDRSEGSIISGRFFAVRIIDCFLLQSFISL